MVKGLIALLFVSYVVSGLSAVSAAQGSPDNARVPPLTSVTDAIGAVWSLPLGTGMRAVLRNGAATGGVADLIVVWQGQAYIRGAKGWGQWAPSATGNWQDAGPVDPTTLPPPPPAVASSITLAWTMAAMAPAAVREGTFQVFVGNTQVDNVGWACVASGQTQSGPDLACRGTFPIRVVFVQQGTAPSALTIAP